MGNALMVRNCVESPCADERLTRAAAWLSASSTPRVTVVGASSEAAAEVCRRALAVRGAAFGWNRTTLGGLAVQLARPELARRGLVPVSGLALDAVSARVVHENRAALGRLEPLGRFPGLPRALARTLGELRLAQKPEVGDVDLARLLAAFDHHLAKAGLADRADTLAIATHEAGKSDVGALLFFDVPLRSRAERDFVKALAARATTVLATVPSGDTTSLMHLRTALTELRAAGAGDGPKGTLAELRAAGAGDGPKGTLEDATFEVLEPARAPETAVLSHLKTALFGEGETAPPRPCGDEVTVLSAPGESRECVEIARLVLREARAGTPFDRIAVLLRAPGYASHLEEALRRAGVPSFFARGMRRPDPGGRALLALICCAAEKLSARRFAEYLSLGEVPDEDAEGAPPPSLPPADRVEPADEEVSSALLGSAATSAATVDEESTTDTAPVAEEDRTAPFGSLRTPRHWERLLVDAAVIGGAARWERRLDGLSQELHSDLAAFTRKGEESLADGVRRELGALSGLRRFALPLIRDLDALPGRATWGEWLDALASLATRAIRRPERVLAVLAELRPMAKVGPVEITEVRLVLERRLSQLLLPQPGRRYGKVYVATIEEARGLSFDVVFVPGLAEKIFPEKVVEDPLLLDEARTAMGADLATNVERGAEERLALRLAVGAANKRVVLSYPRLDVEQARPRTPSFYGLEVLRVAEGELRGFEYLQDKAGKRADARIGWPAPANRDEAIDEAEYDLAVLDEILNERRADTTGQAHYLLTANDHLARALRFRGRRWLRTWKAADGLVDPPEEALAAIREHSLSKRSFSPTALQNFSACPYRFLLSAIHKLSPREDPDAIEELDPMTRGSLVHEVQFELLTELRERGLLPLTPPRLETARAMLKEVLATVAKREHDRLAPAIERVWSDAIESIAADLREWLRLMTEPEEAAWTPAFFELSFGLVDRRAEDPKSKGEPVVLDGGIRLRGSIDLVERGDDGALRATDHKTGKVRAKEGQTVIGGGETLQPVLYALALERLFPETPIRGGRLYYCTAAGGFTRVFMPLSDEAREAAKLVAKVVGESIESGFLPAAPAKDACRFCDFRPVCGPYEEIRTKRKDAKRLVPLSSLRKHR